MIFSGAHIFRHVILHVPGRSITVLVHARVSKSFTSVYNGMKKGKQPELHSSFDPVALCQKMLLLFDIDPHVCPPRLSSCIHNGR